MTAHGHQYLINARMVLYSSQGFSPDDQIRGIGKLTVKGTYYTLSGQGFLIEESPRAAPIADLKLELNQFAQRTVGPDHAALVLGLAYGDDTSMTTETRSEMRTSGLTHLTAVSGANITLIFVLAYRLCAAVVSQRVMLILAGAVASTGYIVLVGPDGSVLRAWVMGTIGALGLVLGHGAYSLSYLATCIIGLLLFDPAYAADVGFALSAVATGSILLLAPAMTRLVSAVLPPILADLITMPLAASLWCTPIILGLSDSVYSYTVLANLLAAPLVAPITLLGLLVLTTYTLHLPPAITELVLHLSQLCTGLLLDIASWCSSLPGSALPVQATPLNLLVATSGVVLTSCVIWWADYRVCLQKPPRRPRLYQGVSS
ncbi:ComEC/Rec2 family competence protein [Rothia nasimurium]|uniref:ComEC/Rec2 family competence protein n=1 Tax=Rothia nasimurium TaxID=85336 RepID=UPI003BA1F054